MTPNNMSNKQSKATDQVREHVDRAHDAISDFGRDGINAEGVLMRPLWRGGALGRVHAVFPGDRNLV
jgi:hypothetical protein